MVQVQNEGAVPGANYGNLDAKLAAVLAGCGQAQDALRTRLRTLSADASHLEAENAEQRAAIKALRSEVARLYVTQHAGSQDLLHLAGKLLALSHVSGVELDNTTKALFRRRGWTATTRSTDGQKQ